MRSGDISKNKPLSATWLAHSNTAEVRLARRAGIMLLAADGLDNCRIGKMLDVGSRPLPGRRMVAGAGILHPYVIGAGLNSTSALCSFHCIRRRRIPIGIRLFRRRAAELPAAEAFWLAAGGT